MDLTGKTALVTGASNGIGAGTARALAARGVRVVLVARDAKALDGVARDVRARGADVAVFPADLTDIEQVETLERNVTAHWGTPDVIVNSAGAGCFQFIEETSMQDFVSQMAAPYFATCFVTRAFIAPMIARGSGHVVNVNSPASRVVWPGAIGYAATRWALRGFSEALRADLAGTGVGVTEAVIGKVATAYWAKNPGSEDRVPSISKLSKPLTPDEAGTLVARGIESGAGVIAAPWSARMLLAQARLAPRAAAQVMIRTGVRRAS